MKKNIILWLIFILFSSCGYFENDGIAFEKSVIGNFIISQQENNEDRRLLFVETDEYANVIIENCKKVVYDSSNQEILVEEYLNPYNSSYYKISILDMNTNKSEKAYKKEKITQDSFDKEINLCKSCNYNYIVDKKDIK